MVDLGGYVIVLVEMKDQRIKLFGSPADRETLEVGDEILEVNGRTMDGETRANVIQHIHQCIRSRTICLRVKRRSGTKLASDLDQSSIQDAFVIAVEQQAKERLLRLQMLHSVEPVDMNRLAIKLNNPTLKDDQQQQRSETLNNNISTVKFDNSCDVILTQDKTDSEEDKQQNDTMVIKKDEIREMAVDCPDSFINKTSQVQNERPVDVPFEFHQQLLAKQTSSPVKKPTPPPRDHLRIERDGRLINRATPPVVPKRIATTQDSQLNNNTKKLQSLESEPRGVDNEAFEKEEKVDLHVEYDYASLVSSLTRLHRHLAAQPALQSRVSAVHSLFLSPHFRSALAVYNRLMQVRKKMGSERVLYAGNGQSVAKECLSSLSSLSTPLAQELSSLLSSYDVEALIGAHDSIVDKVDWGDAAVVCDVTANVSVPSHPGNVRILTIQKSSDPLGATVVNDGDSVRIARIVKGGVADKSQLLHEGDELLSVNSIPLRGKSVNAVCDILASMEGTLTFVVVPSDVEKKERRDTLLHVKAHFDYDPLDDLYIPCRELGLSFQKGDVLHVLSQDDPNWWQAFREGDDEQALAGLVPSKTFQQQRESLRLQISLDKSRDKGGGRKAQTLLCAKTPKRKKKRSGNDGYSSCLDDYDPSEILTYEEVALYYPRANHKRPIVLIGPPNIGRHELRQKLMEDSSRFAAAIPHTSRSRKDHEVDGQDYHFITRAQFEADILSRKFVEHGEYERAYYGTSLEAIRRVVNEGKVCVLNLHPQSLKILRNSDLKPYVVFVAPPCLEKLRAKKVKEGESYKDEDLRQTIEKAREMESQFGHLFDMVVVNGDTQRAFAQLAREISALEREPQWVPKMWVANGQ